MSCHSAGDDYVKKFNDENCKYNAVKGTKEETKKTKAKRARKCLRMDNRAGEVENLRGKESEKVSKTDVNTTLRPRYYEFATLYELL